MPSNSGLAAASLGQRRTVRQIYTAEIHEGQTLAVGGKLKSDERADFYALQPATPSSAVEVGSPNSRSNLLGGIASISGHIQATRMPGGYPLAFRSGRAGGETD